MNKDFPKLPEKSYVRGLAAGVFDLLHPGHLFFLMQASSLCGELTVAILVDPTIDRPEKSRPVESIMERHFRVASLRFVSDIITYETEKDLEDLILSMRFDARFVGSDHRDNLRHEDACVKADVETVIVRRIHDWSSQALRQRVKNAEINRNIP